MKRFESSLFGEALIQAENNKRKNREPDVVKKRIRHVNRLAVQERNLEVKVENLKWNNRRAEKQQLQFAVENAREEGRREERKKQFEALKTIPPPVFIITPPASAETVNLAPMLPTFSRFHLQPPPIIPNPTVSSPRKLTSFLPPIHIFSSPPPALRFEASSSPMLSPNFCVPPPPVPEYVPEAIPSCGPRHHYKPSPIRPSKPVVFHNKLQGDPKKDLKDNPIRAIAHQTEDYWRELAANVTKYGRNGKDFFKNPDDGYTFRVMKHNSGVVKVYLNDTWYPIQGYNGNPNGLP